MLHHRAPTIHQDVGALWHCLEMRQADRFPAPPARPPDVQDDFPGPTLNASLWLDHYLPHWTTPSRSHARYRVSSGLLLGIDADQPEWRPEDALLRVSSIQTGTASGALGTGLGIHRHRPDGMLVRTETPPRMLWAPDAGRVEVTITPATLPGFVTAAWLVGTESETPEDSGEICIVELEAASSASAGVIARTGLKVHGDPRLTTTMLERPADARLAGRSTWSAQWDPSGTVIGVDGAVVLRSTQAPTYPMILLVGLFEVGAHRHESEYPVTATVHLMRGWAL